MTLSLFDQQLFEKVVEEKYQGKNEFTRTEVLMILNEMTKAEKYYPKGQILKGAKYKVFKYFVRYCLYRNLANYDTMLLISGGKGTGKSSFSIMLAREWCSLLGISFSARNHMAYSNSQVQERIDNLPRFSPLVCLSGKTKIIIRCGGEVYFERMSKLEGRHDFEVLSYDKDNKIYEFVKPEKCIMTSKSEKIYEIELENGTKINATKNHRFLMKSGEYKTLEQFSEDDEIVLYSILCKCCGTEFSPKNNDTLYCSIACREKIRRETEVYKTFQKGYRASTVKERKIKMKIYREKNVDIIKERKRLDRIKHRDKYVALHKKYWKENATQLKEKNKIWIKENHNKVRAYQNKYHKMKMDTDPIYKIKRNLRRRMNLAFMDQDVTHHQSFTNYLGCTIEEFKNHIEQQLHQGMTMQNYGEWHIDHIIPCASFNLLDIEQQKACFHYTNLQPLWGKDNLIKGAKHVI